MLLQVVWPTRKTTFLNSCQPGKDLTVMGRYNPVLSCAENPCFSETRILWKLEKNQLWCLATICVHSRIQFANHFEEIFDMLLVMCVAF